MSGTYLEAIWTYDGSFEAPPRYKKSCKYSPFIPDAISTLTPTMPSFLVELVSRVENEIATIQRTAISQRAFQPLSRFLLRSESIASSKIEGLNTTAANYFRDELRHHSGSNVSKTSREIIGNVDAMETAIGSIGEKPELAVEDLIELHRILLVETMPNIAGVVRAQQNWIGGNNYNPCEADYVPPPAENVHELLSDLCEFVNKARVPVLAKAVIAHAQFELIHPFADGNGRVGRALIHVVLKQGGLEEAFALPLSVALVGHKDQYISGITDFRNGDLNEWIEFMTRIIGIAAQLSDIFNNRVKKLQQHWQDVIAEDGVRTDSVAYKIIDVLPSFPTVTVPLLMAAIGSARLSTYRAVERLESLGVLESINAKARNREWVASGFPELVESFEAASLKP